MKNWIFLLLLGASMAQSCHKDAISDNNPDPNTPVALKRLAAVHYQYPGYDPTTETMEYDNQGRVIKYDDGEDLTTLTYSGNQIEITEIRVPENNRQVFHFIGTMDAAGRVTGGTGTGNYNVNTVDQRTVSLEYDADGFLKKATQIVDNNATYEFYYTWQNGNLTQVDNYTDGVKQYSALYEYGTGNADRTPYRPYSFLPGQATTGKKSREMWTKYTRKRDGVPDFTETSSFTKDPEGYITAQHLVYSDGGELTIGYEFK